MATKAGEAGGKIGVAVCSGQTCRVLSKFQMGSCYQMSVHAHRFFTILVLLASLFVYRD